jgi:hypothetical protein
MTQVAELTHRCTKHPEKIQYRTTDQAFDVADRRAPLEGAPIFVYACDHCGYFHLSRKRGTEDIGRFIPGRDEGKVWESETANPRNVELVRDERFVDESPGAKFRADFAHAIREHGSPDILTGREVIAWMGIPSSARTRAKVRQTFLDLGWLSTGATKSQRWHRTLATITDVEVPTSSEVEPAPAPIVTIGGTIPIDQDSPWKILDSKSLGDLTFDQLERTFEAIGYRLRVMVRQKED